MATVPTTPMNRSRRGAALLKLARQFHLYLGVFCAPALLFFAVTGVLQTFSMHQANRTTGYKPPQWLAVAAQIHKNQTTQIRKPQAAGKTAVGAGAGAAIAAPPAATAPAPATPPVAQHNAFPEKLFFALVGWSFLFSVLTGVYLAYKYSRGVWTVTALLVAGVLVPIALLFV